MAIFASRSDQLWSLALQLTEEEMKSQPFPQQEEHGRIIQTKYNQLVSNLSCLGDIIAAMFQKEKLTQKEFEQIHSLQATPIRANEELLSIIARKPRDVFDCFLSLVKDTNQLHLYQMLVSGDDTSDREQREDILDHKDLIRRNFMWLSENMDTENGLITLLHQQNVLTVREREGIFCIKDLFQKKEFLLVLLSRKSPEELVKFLEALEATNQGHLVKELRKPGGSPANPSTVISAVTTTTRVCHKLLPKAVHKFGVANGQVRSSSKSIPPPKTLPKPKPEQNLNPSRSSSKLVPIKPGTQSNSNKHYAKSAHNVAGSTEKTVNFQRRQWDNCLARLAGIESQIQTDIAVKVTHGSSAFLDRQEDSFKMCFRIILRECCHVRKEIVAENYERNMELEELRKISSQYSTTVTLNEVLRAQLNSVQQVLTSERLQWKKERMQLEEQKSKLKTDTKTVTMEMKGSLDKSEYEKQCYKQERDKSNSRLASVENELQRSKVQFDKCNAEVIALRAESERLKKSCDILKRGNGTVNDLEVQLLRPQEDNRDLLKRQVKKMERSSESAQEANVKPIYTRQNATVGVKAPDNDRTGFEEELGSEIHRTQNSEDKLRDAKALLKHFNRKPEGGNITSSTNVCRQRLTSADEELAQRLQTEELLYAEEKKHQWNRDAQKLIDAKLAKAIQDQEEEGLQRERSDFLLPQKTLAEEDEQLARLLQEEEGRNKEFVKCDDAKIALEMQRKEIIEKIIIAKKTEI